MNSVKKLMFAMVAGCVLFEVWTESLNIIQTSSGFKGLKDGQIQQSKQNTKLTPVT
jgi:hypothetical protein